MHTKDILAAELTKANLPDMAAKAATGYYHDFLSPLDTPCIQLAADLAAVGTPEAMSLRLRHMNGEFDASADESDTWAHGPDGKAAMASLGASAKLGDGPPRITRALRPDAQAFDEIRIRTVPRYKTSGLSGDEWRISAAIEFYRKGRKMGEDHYRNVESAAHFLDSALTKICEEGKAFFGGEDNFCDQEGCAKEATVMYRLKARYCREGHKSEPLFGIEVRQFCDEHKRRGDCGLDDADENYEPMVFKTRVTV